MEEQESDNEFDDGLDIHDIPESQLHSPHIHSREPPVLGARPYSSIYSIHKFKSPQRNLFIPGVPIEVKFTNFERSMTTHLLNPNLYTIELRHGNFNWTVHKRYKHIQNLHQQLRIFRATLNIPIPTKSHKERRASFKHELTRNKDKRSRNLPRFPSRPDALVPQEKVELRMKLLQEYLQNLLRIGIYRNHHETANFLEVSHLSFVGEMGAKGKEGMLEKRTRSVHPASTGCNLCGFFASSFCVRCNYICSDLCGSWRSRWVVLKESFVAYIRPKDGRVKAVILFDCGFEVSSGIFSTGYSNGLHIVNLSRHIVVKCPTRRMTHEWLSSIKEVLNNEGRDFTMRNRYYSFTPVRASVESCWYVDGRGYMAAVADAMEAATQEIFIADWWLSPEIHMKRPYNQTDYWRLDTILDRKAAQGVKIFVLLYKEVEVALGINSYYSKQKLVSSYAENIKVIRHPDHAKAGVFLWAHHEKIVVVDQAVAFLGGIDLCYGRWDDFKHRLTDLGNVASTPADNSSPGTAPPCLATSFESDFKLDKMNGSAGVYEEDMMMIQPSPENMKCNTPEMERKSILTAVRTKGKEFMQMLSITSDEGGEEEEEERDVPETQTGDREATSILTEDVLLSSDESGDECKLGEGNENSSKLWPGKDYSNFIVKDFNDLDQPFQDLVDRTKTPRMPWHDIGVMVEGAGARDVARHFIQRWNAAKLEKAKLNPQYPYLLPKTYKDITKAFSLPDVKEMRVQCQVVRSVSHWSGGFLEAETWEGSIHEAYIDAIAKAEHYIYIENQFFISSLPSLQVKNQVADAIYKRLLRAHREGSVFRVYIVLPLLPGFEGEVGTPSGTALHAITHWNYSTISRGKESLLVRLKEAGIEDTSEYVTFHGLRNHSTLNGKAITELIYVHSKLLIVDDRLVICGSANINDRSLLGKRDSEIALVIEDEEFRAGLMNGKTFKSGKYCGSLRRYLFKEHLGLVEGGVEGGGKGDVTDPTCAHFYHHVWRSRALTNTHIYEMVFRCIPSDKARDFASLKKYQQETSVSDVDPIATQTLLSRVQGHLVMLPLNFLQDENLTPNPGSVQGILPTSLWT